MQHEEQFGSLHAVMERIESPEHALNWLRRVAVSRSADAPTPRRVRGIDLWVEMEDKHGAPTEERQSPLETRLEQLLSTLPEAQRAALVLRYQEDMTPEEIAAAVEAPLATVKSNLHRGLKLLRAKATTHLKEYIRGL